MHASHLPAPTSGPPQAKEDSIVHKAAGAPTLVQLLSRGVKLRRVGKMRSVFTYMYALPLTLVHIELVVT
jgi:hypothetical protein